MVAPPSRAPASSLCRAACIGLLLVVASATGACGETTDSLGGAAPVDAAAGEGGAGGEAGEGGESGEGSPGGETGEAGQGGQGGEPAVITLSPIEGPTSYPNAFRDVLGRTEGEIGQRINAVFEQLFHGDPAAEAIYFVVGPDQAFIQDIYHGDVRTEGMGLGMMIAVQLDRRDEFDRLWNYAEGALAYHDGPARGYFRSTCFESTDTARCVDPYGHQQMATALLFAHGRWGSDSGTDYGAAFVRLVRLMREKEAENGGVIDGVTNMIDPVAQLVLDVPTVAAQGTTRPSCLMPAYYELWAQATGDAFWSEAATRARQHLEAAAHADTGLLPVRAEFDGSPVAGSDDYLQEAYRAQLNMTLDQIWSGAHPWYVEEAHRLLSFFTSQGMELYCSSYSLDGSTCLAPHESAHVSVNGITALIATNDIRNGFVEAAWNVATPVDQFRYYEGLLHLVSLLTLGGQFRVY